MEFEQSIFDGELLRSHLASSLPVTKGRVLTFSSSQALLEVFQTLLEEGVLSAPVWDETTSEYCGFVDLQDLLSYVVFEWDKVVKKKADAQPSEPSIAEEEEEEEDSGPSLEELVMTVEDLRRREAQGGVTITYLARRHSFRPVGISASLAEIAGLLGRVDHNHHVWAHRVPLVDDDGTIVNIVSQTSLIAFLSEHEEQMGAIGDMPVGDLHLVTEPCVSVKEDSSALEVFRVMDSTNLSGVAVTDALTGKLVGDLCTADLAYFLKLHVSLRLPVLTFRARGVAQQLAATRGKEGDGDVEEGNRAGWADRPLVACVEDDPLNKVLRTLVATRQHKLWIVDDSYRPVGVVSVSDICKLFAQLCDGTM